MPGMIPFSVLDLSPILAGSGAAQAFRNSLDLARHAERWRYRRYWLAEHHSMTGIGSAATAVLIGHVAGGTSTMRVGAGGIMLPNHSPLVIAEQFGTLESLYPGRIDLGLGRAPGTGPEAARALRRNLASSEDSFAEDVAELLAYFRPAEPDQVVRAVPGAGLGVPVWILGSSLYGAHVAAAFGLPFAFASHFAPQMLRAALASYRTNFRPTGVIDKPYVMIGVNVFAAETDAEGRRLFTSLEQMFLRLRTTGDTGLLGPPSEGFEKSLSPAAKAMIDHAFAYSARGSPGTVRRRLEEIIAETDADELMITGQIYDHAARLRSFEIAAAVRDEIGGGRPRRLHEQIGDERMSDRPISRFPVPDLRDLPEDMRERIVKVQERSGFVPNVFLALAHRPEEFRAFFAYHDALMEKEGGLSKGEREMIVVATSGLNQCLYCVVAHGALLRIREKKPLLADQVATNYRNAEITPRQKAMLDFAVKVSLRAQEISDADVDELRRHGFSLEDVWDIGAIAAFFALSNRMASLTNMRPNDEFYLLGRVPRK
jgi:luciferase family oxidoreductase group 1/uncharacterized peroxidase-related enzyme